MWKGTISPAQMGFVFPFVSPGEWIVRRGCRLPVEEAAAVPSRARSFPKLLHLRSPLRGFKHS